MDYKECWRLCERGRVWRRSGLIIAAILVIITIAIIFLVVYTNSTKDNKTSSSNSSNTSNSYVEGVEISLEDLEKNYSEILEKHKYIGKAFCSNIIYDTNESPYITTIKDEGDKISISYYGSYSDVLNFMIWYNKNSYDVTDLVVMSKKPSESILLGNIYLNPYITNSDTSVMYGLKNALENTVGANVSIYNKDSKVVYTAKKIYYDDAIDIIINAK